MGRRDGVAAGLRHQALLIWILAAGVMLAAAFPAWAQNRPAGSDPTAGPSPMSRVAQAAGAVLPDGHPPPPGAIVVSQIHNAPGWEPSHTYTATTGPYTRVVSGPGWNPANRRYAPGQTLDAYQLVSPGTCRSAAGSGPRSTGAAITDGTCTWKYLSGVDYISITGWAFDNRPWKSGTLYHYTDYVTSDSPLRAYALIDDSCTGTVAPTGTGIDAKELVVTSDGCHWQYQADIIYTSEKSYIPTETYTRRNSPATLMLRANYEAQLWNDREYVAGQNGEAVPIRTQSHNDYRSEGSVIIGCSAAPCYHIIITTAPGESFHDRLTPSDPLTGYDPSKGVAIRNDQPYRWPNEPAGIDVHDNLVDIVGLQIKSVHGAAINGRSSFGNRMTIRDCILDGGSDDRWTSHAAVATDTSSVIANSLIISHASLGIMMKYPGYVLHSTIVSPDRIAGSVGIMTYYKWIFNDTTVSNTAIFGFAHAAAHFHPGTSWSPHSSRNITDAPADDSGAGPWPYGRRGETSTVDRLPDTIYGASMARTFVKPGSDWRPSGDSPLRGAGGAFGTITVNCFLTRPACPERMTYTFDTPDIIGTPRPQAGRYDIGAWQGCAAPAGDQHSGCTSIGRAAVARP